MASYVVSKNKLPYRKSKDIYLIAMILCYCHFMLKMYWFKRQIAKVFFEYQERVLKSSTPNIFQKRVEKRVLNAFRRATASSPAYRQLLKEHNVSTEKIKNLNTFQREVPLLDKKALFSRYSLEEIFPGVMNNCSGRIWTSSGSTSEFSFGYESPKARPNALMLDFMLHFFFNTLKAKTLFINCLADAWPISLKFVQYANVGTREDAAIALIKKLTGTFDQFILCGEPLFLKKLVESAISEGIDLSKTSVNLLTGGDYVAESYTRYMTTILNPGSPSPKNRVFSVMGLAEFGVGIFFETPELVTLRSFVAKEPILKKQIFEKADSIPQLMQYNPFSVFVETTTNTDGDHTLVLTNLSHRAELPLIRYNTGDLGRMLNLDELRNRLGPQNKTLQNGLELPFPLAMVQGKKRSVRVSEGPPLDASFCSEILFSSPTIAAGVTGVFFITPATENQSAKLKVQLSAESKILQDPPDAARTLVDRLKSRRIEVEFVPYERFQTGMGLQFDRKIKYQ